MLKEKEIASRNTNTEEVPLVLLKLCFLFTDFREHLEARGFKQLAQPTVLVHRSDVYCTADRLAV